MKKAWKFGLVILAVLGLLCVAFAIFASQADDNLKALSNKPIETVDLSAIPDGAYEGSYTALPISATVQVTVRNNKIVAIDLIRHINGHGKAAEAIPANVVKAQSLQVDVISGATYSSKVILLAIEDALKNAIKK